MSVKKLPHVFTVTFTADVIDQGEATFLVDSLARQAEGAVFGPASHVKDLRLVTAVADQAAIAARTQEIVTQLRDAVARANEALELADGVTVSV